MSPGLGPFPIEVGEKQKRERETEAQARRTVDGVGRHRRVDDPVDPPTIGGPSVCLIGG